MNNNQKKKIVSKKQEKTDIKHFQNDNKIKL